MENFLFSRSMRKKKASSMSLLHLIESILSAGETSTSASEFYAKLCSHADHIMETTQRHFYNEEVQVSSLLM